MGKKIIDHGLYMELLITNHAHTGSILFDKDDYEKVMQYPWSINSNGYATYRPGPEVKGRTTIRMHRYLLGYSGSHDIDHINGNRLDNRKGNLRICSRAVNLWNTTRQKHDMHNISHNGDLYRVEIMRGGKRFRSKNFHCLEDAKKIRDTIYSMFKSSDKQNDVIGEILEKGGALNG